MSNRASPLAIDGGLPVRRTMLPYARQTITEDDVRAVVEVLTSDRLTTGPMVEWFETAFAKAVGVQYAISVSSGTAALYAAAAAGLTAGDEVIVTPMTFCATINCVIAQGATPVFADVCEDTLNIDPEDVARKITTRTKAIIPVDYAGHPADLEPIMRLARLHGLTVIEDACHALGAVYRGLRIGGIAHMSTFSFHPVKHITTGEGGMVTTNDAELAKRVRWYRNQGVDAERRGNDARGAWYYDVEMLGQNARLPDLGCALGASQLSRLPENLTRRRAIAAQYREAFADLEAIDCPVVRSDVEPAWHLFPIQLRSEALRVGRREVFDALRAEGIGVNVHYLPVYRYTYLSKKAPMHGTPCPNAEGAYERLITLPMFHGMTERDTQDVVEAVTKVLIRYHAHVEAPA